LRRQIRRILRRAKSRRDDDQDGNGQQLRDFHVFLNELTQRLGPPAACNTEAESTR
jgi:hypothetical protein